MENTIIRGNVWACGDYVDTYQILPKEYWMGDIGSLNEEELAKHVMEGYESEEDIRDKKYNILVAGKNFGGGGKSIEHPIIALKGAGIKAVIAESVSRYFYRNLINNGIVVITKDEIMDFVNNGDELEINLENGKVFNITQDKEESFVALPEFVLKILQKGGYKNYIKAQL